MQCQIDQYHNRFQLHVILQVVLLDTYGAVLDTNSHQGNLGDLPCNVWKLMCALKAAARRIQHQRKNIYGSGLGHDCQFCLLCPVHIFQITLQL